MTCPEVLQRAAAVPLFHLVGRGQAYRTPVLIFLNVIPDELLSQPNGLPGCKLSILEEQTMADGEPSATLQSTFQRDWGRLPRCFAAHA
jgi:hypothetical protein